MFKINKKLNHKGQTLIMVLVIFSSVAILGLILIEMYTRDLRLSFELNESTKALYAADACQEMQLYNYYQGGDYFGFNKGYKKINNSDAIGGFYQVGNNNWCNPAYYGQVGSDINVDSITSIGKNSSGSIMRSMEIYLPSH